jgi:hypothetical protein
MSKLDPAPFKIHDKIEWSTSVGTGQTLKRKGIISDAYFQPKTKLRREGWRLLIRKEYLSGTSDYLEKYFDEVKRY